MIADFISVKVTLAFFFLILFICLIYHVRQINTGDTINARRGIRF